MQILHRNAPTNYNDHKCRWYRRRGGAAPGACPVTPSEDMSRKCQYRKRDGSQCGADAQASSDLCIFHDPRRAKDGERARRAGGLTRSRLGVALPDEVADAPLESVANVSKLLAETINEVRRGQLAPRVANTIGYLSGILLKSLEQSCIEQRLSRLEATMDEAEVQRFHFVTTENR